MKHFLALPAILRTATLLASASQHSFSVHDDVLAFPQYEVRFYEEEWLSEEQAHTRLANGGKLEESREPQYQLQQRLRKPSSSSSEDDDESGNNPVHGEKESVSYEKLKLQGHDWLCRVPRIKKPDETGTAGGFNSTLSKAEEEKELARASDRGWELLSGMQDNCIYFVGGWWSYQFCYNQGVRQFHQLPAARGIPNWPPQEDPGVPGFMLGVYHHVAAEVEDDHQEEGSKWDGGSGLDKSGDAKRTRVGSGELVQRGESRYLTQTLGGGTRCDLTGKHRKIEIQYHCNPQGGERISLIKEMATCTYLMVIQTPRLCNDVAFQPPQKDLPHTVSCYPIVVEDDVEDYKRELAELQEADRIYREEAASATLTGLYPPAQPVGDIYVGMHRLVPEGKKIEKSVIVGGGKEVYVDTLASSDGKTLTQEDLKRLGLGDAKAIEKLKKQIEKVAQGEAWKLDVIDTPRGREYRGIVGSDEEEGEEGSDLKKQKKRKVKEDDDEDAAGQKKREKSKPKEKKPQQEGSEGSEEEYFKEEL